VYGCFNTQILTVASTTVSSENNSNYAEIFEQICITTVKWEEGTGDWNKLILGNS